MKLASQTWDALIDVLQWFKLKDAQGMFEDILKYEKMINAHESGLPCLKTMKHWGDTHCWQGICVTIC